MDPSERFANISPLDHRYYAANRELFERLSLYVSETAAVRYAVRVEAALLSEHVQRLLPDWSGDLDEIASVHERVSPVDVATEEEKTRHNVRAIVNVLQAHLPGDVRHLIHLGATSVDILDTAAAMRYRDVTREVLVPLLADLLEALISRAEGQAETEQIGRTHGQFAVPITVGFALAEYVARLGDCLERIHRGTEDLRGKISGAVGSYNATSVLYRDPEEFERAVLSRLSLLPGEHATQIVAPEPLLRLLLEFNTAFGVIANLADDLRNLQRSEIGEFREFFAPGQVGSSTMPHKRNPWNAEHVKSLWKAFAPRAMTWFMDQISEHQRDLSNSASARFIADYVAGFAAAAARMLSIVRKLDVDTERIERNLSEGSRMVLAEPMYIVLAAAGHVDAHERVRRLTLEAERTGVPLIEVARRKSDTWREIRDACESLTGLDADVFFADPRNYTGRAADRARKICERGRERLRNLRRK